MALKAEGTWACTITGAKFGHDYRGMPAVQINGRIDDGQSKGMMFAYEEGVDARQLPYTVRSCKAVGWSGKSFGTLEADVAAWVSKTGGKSTVLVEHVPVKKGKKYDAWVAAGCPENKQPVWDKAKAIGVGAQALSAPTQQSVTEADEMLRMLNDSTSDAPSDAPPADDEAPF